MHFDYSEDKIEHKAYYPARYLAKFLSFFVYKKVNVIGKEHIPSDGPLIIASNHIAFSDPAIIVANCPRTVHFMAKSELFEKRWKAVFMRNMNAFPVKRNHSDRDALRWAKKIIDNGWVLGIFPEGRRVRKSPPTQAKTGIAYLARVTGADILPVCIYRNIDDDGVWHSLTLSYGKIIKNCELGFAGKDRNAELNNASEIIMNEIKRLWEKTDEGYSS